MAPVCLNPALSLPDHFQPKKVALAYTGGRETSCLIPWLKERYDCEVIAVAVDVGLPDGLSGVEAKVLASGASRCHLRDARDELLTEHVYPALWAGALHERHDLLGTAMAWPLIAKHQVEIALREGCDALAHGDTGTEHERAGIEPTYQALAPLLRVIAPGRMGDSRSRDDAMADAGAHGLPTAGAKAAVCSTHGNLWHESDDDSRLHEPSRAAAGDSRGRLGERAAVAAHEAHVTIGFERGTPIAINGQRLDPIGLAAALNELGDTHGVGQGDRPNIRLVGTNRRGVYESPGGILLTTAHRELERLTVDHATMRLKDLLAHIYADVVYTGHWFSPLREALDAFVTKTRQPVTGEIRVELAKGSCSAAGWRIPFDLHDGDLAAIGAADVYQRADAEGLIRLFSLGQRMAAQRGRRPREQDVEMVK